MARMRSLVLLASCLTALSLATAASAASRPVRLGALLGPYRILLKIGPAEQMSMSGGMNMSGEVMIGGKQAACKVKGMHMAYDAAQMRACNHHIELHVYSKGTSKPVMHARVSIVMVDAKTHTGIDVPIMTMRGAGMSMSDYHYGNNIYAPAGTYAVAVTINGFKTTLSARLT